MKYVAAPDAGLLQKNTPKVPKTSCNRLLRKKKASFCDSLIQNDACHGDLPLGPMNIDLVSQFVGQWRLEASIVRCILIELSCPDTRALGIRGLSSYIESRGHSSTMVFLPPGIERMTAGVRRLQPYSSRLIDSLMEVCSSADVVGISLLSYYYDLGVQITKEIRDRLGKPVIWGGYHPMGAVEDSLEHADWVCMGEGEPLMAALLDDLQQSKNGLDSPNLAYRKGGQIIRNPIQPLIQNLNELPFLDYRLNAHFVLDPVNQELALLDKSRSRQLSQMGPLSRLGPMHHYQSFMSRGCPYSCTYCCESLIHELYQGQRQMRRRDPENLADEIEAALKESDFISAISFSDDSFSEANDEEIEHFAEVYRSRIALPFSAQFSPNAISRRKLDALIAAGLKYAEVGIQSGSESIKKLYKRNLPNEKILRACKELNERIGKILPPDYHFIVDNPWESAEDLIDTLHLVLEMPKPRGIKVSSLVFYPGTGLYDKAKKENLLPIDVSDAYRKNFGALHPTPANLLFFLTDLNWIPNKLIRLLVRPALLKRKGRFAQKLSYALLTFLGLSRRAAARLRKMLIK
jgi:anaerobic magnesium-protoporphyrin IX monomethyl ester cyclase